jgi:hypothetical protein
MLENRAQLEVGEGSSVERGGSSDQSLENLLSNIALAPAAEPIERDPFSTAEALIPERIHKQPFDIGESFEISFYRREAAKPSQHVDMPALEMAAELRAQLDSFVNSNLYPTGKVGFLSAGTPEFNIGDVRKSIEESLMRARVMEEQESSDGLVNNSEHAAEVAEVLDDYLTFLRVEAPEDVISQNSQELLLSSMIQLKTQLAAVSQDALMESFQALAQRDMQAIQGMIDPAMLQAGGQIEINASGTVIEAATRSAQGLLAQDEVEVLTIAKGVRAALREVRGELMEMEPEPMGFTTGPDQGSVSLTGLIETLTSSSARLEEIFADRSDSTPTGIQVRSIAQNLQSAVDSFRIPLIRKGDREVGAGIAGAMLSSIKGIENDVSELVKGIKGFLKELEQQFSGPAQEGSGFRLIG